MAVGPLVLSKMFSYFPTRLRLLEIRTRRLFQDLHAKEEHAHTLLAIQGVTVESWCTSHAEKRCLGQENSIPLGFVDSIGFRKAWVSMRACYQKMQQHVQQRL